jgi:hypothetical protein
MYRVCYVTADCTAQHQVTLSTCCHYLAKIQACQSEPLTPSRLSVTVPVHCISTHFPLSVTRQLSALQAVSFQALTQSVHFIHCAQFLKIRSGNALLKCQVAWSSVSHFPKKDALPTVLGPIRTKRLRWGLKLLVQRALQCRH